MRPDKAQATRFQGQDLRIVGCLGAQFGRQLTRRLQVLEHRLQLGAQRRSGPTGTRADRRTTFQAAANDVHQRLTARADVVDVAALSIIDGPAGAGKEVEVEGFIVGSELRYRSLRSLDD